MLAILGTGPLEAARRDALVGELGLDDAVVLPGPDRIRDWLERADDVRAHARAGRASASSCWRRCSPALPVVATRVSAVPEVVADGETGILVEPGDEASLARALSDTDR